MDRVFRKNLIEGRKHYYDTDKYYTMKQLQNPQTSKRSSKSGILPRMQPFLHIIADYGTGDPAFGEVVQRIQSSVADVNPSIFQTSVAFSDTIAGGFWIYQYAMRKASAPLFVYSNIAPRRVHRAAMKNNSGEGLKYGKLTNGVDIVDVHSEYIFLFV